MKQQMKDSAYTLKFAEVKKMTVAAVNFRDRCIIKSLWWFGLRRHELVGLEIPRIDYERKRIAVIGKGNKVRVIPVIEEEVLSDLRILVGDRKKGSVFLSNENKALSLRLVNHIVGKVAERAEVKHPNPKRVHVNPHLIRHSMARWLKSQGYPQEWVQNFLGHESIKTTMDMYGTMSIDEMQEIAAGKVD